MAAVIAVVLAPFLARGAMRPTPGIVPSLLTRGVLGTGLAYLWNLNNVMQGLGPTVASTTSRGGGGPRRRLTPAVAPTRAPVPPPRAGWTARCPGSSDPRGRRSARVRDRAYYGLVPPSTDGPDASA
ncbi:hypothetical protein [Cellulomonas hominis]